MLVPSNRRQPHKRQNDNSAIPSAPGVSGEATIVGNAPSSSLIYNSSGGTAAAAAATSAVTTAPVPSSTASASAAVPPSATSSSGSSIPLGTVIGSCVGAFLGFLCLVLVGVWCYKRTGGKERKSRSTHPSSPMSASLNARSDNDRRRSRLQPWNKLGEKEVDVWEGMIPSPATREVITFPPPIADPPIRGSVDKLGTMFKSSTSLHSKETSSEGHDLGDSLAESAQFAKYHPHLAEELAKTVTPIRETMARQDTGPPISWDGETIREDDAFVSFHSAHIDSSHMSSASEAISPIIVEPKNTPTATSSQPHRWESAEVMHYYTSEYPDENEAKNPFSDTASEARKSLNNPFFNARDQLTMKKTSNPFADHPKRPFTHGQQDSNTSMSSISSTDRAMQSLIAALDVTPEEIHERLRVASMQPSVQSVNSAMDDDASVAEFPLPPTQVPRF